MNKDDEIIAQMLSELKDKQGTCNVCNKSDLPTQVLCSGLGGMSFNYCELCGALGAEPIVGGGCTSYSSCDDSYYDSSDNHLPIKLKNGEVFNTRGEYVKYKYSKCRKE